MEGFSPQTSFGPQVAATYDDELRGDEAAATDFLASLVDGHTCGEPSGEPSGELSRALEFAIGTGRIALPLSERGVRVDGIELSAAMIERLRAKPGGAALDVHLGDMTATRTGRRYGLVYLVFNTIFNLLRQEEQVACFENAAMHLGEGGVFVVEAAVPSAWLPSEAYARPERITATSVTLDVCTYDPVTQLLEENQVRIGTDGIAMMPISCRLAWPSELDLMARLVGLRLRERWGGWHHQPYTGRDLHVSVYEQA